MTLTEITNFHQFREIYDYERAVVYLYLESCPACEEMSPIFQRIAGLEIFENIAFFIVNTAKVDGARKAMEAKYYPHISVFQNGKAVLRIEEVTHELENEIKVAFDHIARSNETPPPPTKPLCQIARACTGQPTERSSFLFDLFRRRNKDRERGCIFRPDSNDNGLIIGDAKDGRSYFRITMWTAFPDELEKVCFSVDFMPFDHARFETAIFSASFEEIEISDASANLKDEPIRIRDVFPASKDGKSEKELLEGGVLIQIKEEDDMFTTPDPATQTVVSTTDVNGIGIYSSTARWTFSQDMTVEPKRGLDASNTVFLVLPQKTEMVLMKFWAEAVLVRKGGSRVHLRIGTEQNCYERILDISP